MKICSQGLSLRLQFQVKNLFCKFCFWKSVGHIIIKKKMSSLPSPNTFPIQSSAIHRCTDFSFQNNGVNNFTSNFGNKIWAHSWTHSPIPSTAHTYTPPTHPLHTVHFVSLPLPNHNTLGWSQQYGIIPVLDFSNNLFININFGDVNNN